MVEAKIKALRDELERHNYNYYVLSAPTISDFEFDKMMKELQELEAAHPEFADPDSPTRRVGSDLSKEFEQVVHKYPMLSLRRGRDYRTGRDHRRNRDRCRCHPHFQRLLRRKVMLLQLLLREIALKIQRGRLQSVQTSSFILC